MATSSRLSKSLERKSEKRLILSVLGIVIVLFLLFRYGMPALISFSDFMAGSGSSQTNSGSKTFVAVPIINDSISATNSATTTIDGNAAPKEKIELYVNDNLADSVDTKDDGTFHFKDVALTLGNNVVKVKANKGSVESDFSDSLTIQYKTTSPGLLIEEPSNSQNFPKETENISVKGKTDPDVKVTVNGFWAIDDDSGNFSYNLPLQGGTTTIKVVATDSAGNSSEKDINVTKDQ